MIIQVNNQYYYNAPQGIKVGDEVELPLPSGGSTWIGKVTYIPIANSLNYIGDIRAIVRKVEPQRLTIEARSRSEMRRKLLDALDDMRDDPTLASMRDGGQEQPY